MTAMNPPVVWAQRKDQLFLKIDLPDVKDSKIDLQSDKLIFSGTSNGKAYQTELVFFEEIDKEASKFIVRPREIEFVLVKKESGPYWDRLLKEPGKRFWLKVDWNKWKDEDEVDEQDAGGFDMGGMGGFDMGSMGNMGDMGGMDFGDEDDSDDDGLEDDPEQKEEEKKDDEPAK